MKRSQGRHPNGQKGDRSRRITKTGSQSGFLHRTEPLVSLSLKPIWLPSLPGHVPSDCTPESRSCPPEEKREPVVMTFFPVDPGTGGSVRVEFAPVRSQGYDFYTDC